LVGLISAAILLFVAIDFGFRVPGVTFLDPFGGAGALDYRALAFGSFAPLRGDFIARQLGSVIGATSVEAAGFTRESAGLAPFGAGPEPVVISHRFTNDDLAHAYPVSSVPFTAKTNTTGASQQPGEPTDCAPVGGTAWYRYRAPRSIGLIADTFGSTYATALGVYSGTRPSELRRIGCNTDARGFAQVAFAAKRNTTYWFQIAGPLGGGDLVFNLTLQGVITRSSISSTGAQSDAHARQPTMSADGRFVAFYSGSQTLTPSSPPPPPCVPVAAAAELCRPAVFARDRLIHRMIRVDRAPANRLPSPAVPAGDVSITGSMSADGRYIAFWSTYPDLVANDTNDNWDVFVLDQLTDKVRRVSVSSEGDQGNSASFYPALSVDGRYIAFTSSANNLVPGDANGVPDVFLHDRRTARTFIVSVGSRGERANNARPSAFPEAGSHLVSMSSNGRYVVFRSAASNLVRGDTNDAADYFVRDVKAGSTKRVSVSSSGEQANADSRQPVGVVQWSASDDGRYVVFNSDASNLVGRDENNAEDVFVRDLVRGITRRVSVSSDGAQANRGVGDQDPSSVFTNNAGSVFVVPENRTQLSYSATPDGQYVAFSSGATNLVPRDTNEANDVYLRHIPSGTTTLLSVASTGVGGDGASNAPVLSADGRFVAFQSAATNLVAGDTNEVEDIFVNEIPRGHDLSRWY
jgi:Tol biopolymer transport system component